MTRSLLVALAALGLSCTGEDPPPSFDEMTRDEKLAFMVTDVEPRMRELFLEYDAPRYAGFSCETCHGPDAASAGYPKPQVLPALPREGTLAAAQALNPDGTAFMLESVFPEMAEFLGREKYNADTAPDGFRCLGCHAEAPP